MNEFLWEDHCWNYSHTHNKSSCVCNSTKEKVGTFSLPVQSGLISIPGYFRAAAVLVLCCACAVVSDSWGGHLELIWAHWQLRGQCHSVTLLWPFCLCLCTYASSGALNYFFFSNVKLITMLIKYQGIFQFFKVTPFQHLASLKIRKITPFTQQVM